MARVTDKFPGLTNMPLTFNDDWHDWIVGYTTRLVATPEKSSLFRFMIFDKKVEELKSIKVHGFEIDLDLDPNVSAAYKLYDWQKTPCAKWIAENSEEPPTFSRYLDQSMLSYTYSVKAVFRELKQTEYYLRWS